uniref:Ion transport domain-containing protein n=1 Tax=Phaeomonas parva TaxID=124430 RepID=A0A7S1U343_9STRA|mmetsp:Transcript_28950/g.92556  ORF Transcript_28950/g.92556 Transcript_28950/m.92556 type:complete len:956 (+) Transcript_28950:219-3086(+)
MAAVHPEPPPGDVASDSKKEVTYVDRALFVFDETNPLRAKCLEIVNSKGTFCFDNIILIFIALNSILTAMADYENVDDDGNPEPNGSARNTIIYVSEFIFLVVYTGEFLIKIIAFGFAWGNDNVYLKDPWNVLDFITVIASYLALDPTLPNLSAIRTFRAFRPLRSVNRFPGLKRLVTALLDSLVGLVDVVLLLLFLLLIYSILGMQLFQGLQHARCRVVPHPVIVPSDCTDVTNECWGQYLDMLTTVNATTSDYNYNHPAYICLTKDDGVTPEDNFDLDWTKDSSPWNVGGLDCVWPEDADDERVCSLPNNNLNGDYTCPSQRWCGSNYDDQGNRRFKEVDYPYGFNRMNSGTYVAGLNFGITNFDNIFSALLSCFQAVTMEGWTDIMYQIQDGVNGPIGSIFFVSLIVIGSFVMLSLVLAVVEEQVASPLVPVKTEEQIQKEKEDATVRRNRRTASMAEMAVLKKRLSTAKIHTSPKGKREELAEVAEVAESAESADAEGEDGEKPPTLGTKRSMSKLQIAAKIVALNETTTKSTRLSIVTAETLADEPALRMWVITIIGSDLFANFMNLVILVNTIVLAMDKYPVDEDEEATLDVVNMVLTFIFIIEFAMMIYGLGPKGYCADRFNIFDGFIVLVSILELLIGLFDKPKGGGGGGGVSREEVVYQKCGDFLDRLPEDYVEDSYKQKIQRLGGLSVPLNIFLFQEIQRLQKVIALVRFQMTQLQLAIRGEVVMTEALQDALDSISDGAAPKRWIFTIAGDEFSWILGAIGMWFTSLQDRDRQNRKWLNEDRPNSYCLTYFFNPNGFLTAMKQEVTRRHKGENWALDDVVYRCEVTTTERFESVRAPPPEGVYVHGLSLEGGAWSRGDVCLIESTPKVLYVQLPVLHVSALTKTEESKRQREYFKPNGAFHCPVYKYKSRTDRFFIFKVPLKPGGSRPPSHWTLRGTGLLCNKE